MGESDKGVDSVVDGLENLGLASEVTVVVGDDGEGTFKCERELLSRGCGYFKALFAFPGKIGRVGHREEVRIDVIGHETFQDVLDIIGATGRIFSDVVRSHGLNRPKTLVS